MKYGDSVQGVTLLMMLSRELVTSCSSCGFSCRLWLKTVGLELEEGWRLELVV